MARPRTVSEWPRAPMAPHPAPCFQTALLNDCPNSFEEALLTVSWGEPTILRQLLESNGEQAVFRGHVDLLQLALRREDAPIVRTLLQFATSPSDVDIDELFTKEYNRYRTAATEALWERDETGFASADAASDGKFASAAALLKASSQSLSLNSTSLDGILSKASNGILELRKTGVQDRDPYRASRHSTRGGQEPSPGKRFSMEGQATAVTFYAKMLKSVRDKAKVLPRTFDRFMNPDKQMTGAAVTIQKIYRGRSQRIALKRAKSSAGETFAPVQFVRGVSGSIVRGMNDYAQQKAATVIQKHARGRLIRKAGMAKRRASIAFGRLSEVELAAWNKAATRIQAHARGRQTRKIANAPATAKPKSKQPLSRRLTTSLTINTTSPGMPICFIPGLTNLEIKLEDAVAGRSLEEIAHESSERLLEFSVLGPGFVYKLLDDQKVARPPSNPRAPQNRRAGGKGARSGDSKPDVLRGNCGPLAHITLNAEAR